MKKEQEYEAYLHREWDIYNETEIPEEVAQTLPQEQVVVRYDPDEKWFLLEPVKLNDAQMKRMCMMQQTVSAMECERHLRTIKRIILFCFVLGCIAAGVVLLLLLAGLSIL